MLRMSTALINGQDGPCLRRLMIDKAYEMWGIVGSSTESRKREAIRDRITPVCPRNSLGGRVLATTSPTARALAMLCAAVSVPKGFNEGRTL